MPEGYLLWNVTVRAFDPPAPPPPMSVYTLSNSCFAFGGTDYVWPGYCWWWDAVAAKHNPPNLNWSMYGTENIDCGLYGGAASLTIFYEHSQKAILDAYALGLGVSPVAFSESIFVPTGGIYVYQGDPSGWSIVSGYTTPPTLTLVP